ncbi:hypothetical protein [Chryseobacterium sp. CH1]|uniref:hypothetical protein n=1 Tax=Chryseobacterium sp. CH1 TaxID=713551 RepID=UPI001E5B871B|nr:hypothetical protein [Chryseobacterium sp. CH1]
MFLGNSDSTEILKNIFKERKDYGYRIFEHENADASAAQLVSFWKKMGSIPYFLLQKILTVKMLNLKYSDWLRKIKFIFH